MKQEITFIDHRETVISSIAKDCFSLGLLISGFYINHTYLGDGVILQLTMAILFFALLFKYASRRIKKVSNKEDAIKHIESLFQDNNEE